MARAPRVLPNKERATDKDCTEEEQNRIRYGKQECKARVPRVRAHCSFQDSLSDHRHKYYEKGSNIKSAAESKEAAGTEQKQYCAQYGKRYVPRDVGKCVRIALADQL